MSQKTADTIILIPTYNERKNLRELLSQIFSSVSVDVLIIDDNSPDGTASLAKELQKSFPGLHVLRRERKEGLGLAYKSGFAWALARPYEFFLMMDADLSHDPKTLPLFLEKIKVCDAVFGSRYLRGVRVYNWSFKRLLLSKLSNTFVHILLNLKSTDTTTAYKCFRRKVLETIKVQSLRGKQNAFLIELVFHTMKAGFKTEEIPFLFTEREEGESKMRFSVAIESLFTTFRLFLFRR